MRQIPFQNIIFVELPFIGQKINKGDTIGTIEAVKIVADIFAPIDGEVLEVNDKIESNPDYVNSDPYKNGWLIKIKVDNISSVNELLNSKEYSNLIS